MEDISNTMKYNGKDKFRCAKIYTGKGGEYPVNACNTGTDRAQPYSLPEGYAEDTGYTETNSYRPMGTIFGMAIEK